MNRRRCLDARVAKTGHVSGAMFETQSPAVGKKALSTTTMWRTCKAERYRPSQSGGVRLFEVYAFLWRIEAFDKWIGQYCSGTVARCMNQRLMRAD